jgi:predicted DNA-binding transcriptional regulator YafY
MDSSLAYRLAYILIKLNQGETLQLKALSQELGVSIRTIQRDINERFAELPIERENGTYQMARHALGEINIHDIEKFAQLAGIKQLFPSLDVSFVKRHIQALQDQVSVSAIGVHATHQAGFSEQSRQVFFMLEKAISQQKIVSFDYTTREHLTKFYQTVHPYRLTHQDGFWYLSAVHNEALKSFALARIASLVVTKDQFTRVSRYEDQLRGDDSVWLGEKFTVTLAVTGKAIQYFKQKQLVPQQAIITETDETLTVTSQIRHEDQILPIVQYWIPYVRIIQPKQIQKSLIVQLTNYTTQ